MTATDFRSPALFLADCHLPLIPHPATAGWTPRVVRFLTEVAPRAQSLFVLGDLFDFWFEWRHSVPARGFQVLSALNSLVRQGRRVVYLGGNHDGHVGTFLEREVGLMASRQPMDITIDGGRFHIIHGDGIAPRDVGYRMLRRTVRWGPTETLYRLLHPDVGIWIAYRLSRFSRSALSDKDRFGEEPYRRYARRKLRQGFNYVVIGHHHYAERLEAEGGVFMAIGDWIKNGSYGLFADGELRLEWYRD